METKKLLLAQCLLSALSYHVCFRPLAAVQEVARPIFGIPQSRHSRKYNRIYTPKGGNADKPAVQISTQTDSHGPLRLPELATVKKAWKTASGARTI